MINRTLSIVSIQTLASGWVTSFACAAKWAVRLGALLAVGAVRGHLCIGQTPVTFPGSTAVGVTSSVLTVAVVITGIGTSVAPQAVTEGIAGEDFTAVGGSCSGGVAYTTGQSCTVDVTFGPKSPGLRSGAVVLKAVDGSLLGSTLLTGKALGSLAVLQPGRIDTVAGNGAWTFHGDGVSAIMAPIFLPTAVAVDAAGNLFLSDSNNNRIRRVDAVSNAISTVAGDGIPGFSGDGGRATQASISAPAGLVIDGAGNIYFADASNSVIRRIDAVSGVITTVAGTGGVEGYAGDGALATSAKLSLPQGVTLDAAHNLYIADTGNNVVRVVGATTGTIWTIAGTGMATYNGDGQLATAAALSSPWNTAIGVDGLVYIADLGNNRVRRIDAVGMISTVVGNGTPGFGGDGGAAAAALLDSPAAVVFDPAGNLYVADAANNRVRKVTVSTGLIDTISGNGLETFSGDTGPATKAGLYGPYALYFDGSGNLFVADMFHNRIRRISGTTIALQYAVIRVTKVSPPQSEGLENDGNANLTLATPVLVNAALDPATTTCAAGVLPSDALCKLGVQFAPTTVGTVVNGSVTLNSDAGNSPDVISISGPVLTVEPTVTTVVSSANPSLVTASVTFTATVTSLDAGRSGTVTFLDAATTLCNNVPIPPGASAACSTSALTLGSHSITASYSGDANNQATTSSPLIQVVQQSATAALATTPNPAVANAAVTLSVTVTAPTGVPTGVVVFYDGTTAIGSANLTNGTGTLSTSSLPVGAHNLSAQYSGDASNAPGTSNVVSQVISAGTTLTTIATSNANVDYAIPVTLTATVSATNGPAPTGAVQFMEGPVVLGSAPMNSSGVATLTLSSLSPGGHSILAVYPGDGVDAASASGAILQTVFEIPTTSSLVSDAASAAAGVAIHFTATVSVAAGATADGAVTGQVTFRNGGFILGVAALNPAGVATLGVTTLPVGSASITATYSGDSRYVASTSGTLPETINLAMSRVTLAGPSVVDVTILSTFTTILAAPGPTATGTITLYEGAAIIAANVVTAQGRYTFATSSLTLGTHILSVSYSGDANYVASTSNAMTVVVQQAATSSALRTSLNPQIVGQSVTLTASITSTTANPTGTFTFLDGGVVLGSSPMNAGVATLTLSTLSFGTHPITAVYSSDPNHAASTSPVLTERIVQAAAVALISNNNPSIAASAVVFTAQLAAFGALIPSGQVAFFDGLSLLGTSALDASGTGSLALSSLLVGSHAITVGYPGDVNFAASTSTILIQTVQSASTQIGLSASANPSIYGTPLTFTAAITTTGAIATGLVTFTDAGGTLGTGLLNSGGVATLTISSLSPGSHGIVVGYGGDTQTSASSSVPLIVVVKQLTSVALSSNTNPAATLSPVVLTAAVGNSGAGAASGTITFTDGSTLLGTVAVSPTSVAALTVPSLSAGNHTILAAYSGDSVNFPGLSATLAQGVSLRATVTALTAIASNPANSQQVTLISTVRWNGAVTPTGTITFSSGTSVVGSVAVDATGVATLTIFVASGSQSILASYSGDSAYASSDSIAIAVSGGPATQFTMSIDPPTMSLQSKQHGVVNVTLTSVKGFSDTLEFGCLGLPFAATCTFSSTQMKLAANGVQTIQMTIDTGNPLGAGAIASTSGSPGTGVLFCFIPCTLMAGFLLRRKGRGLPPLRVFAIVLYTGLCTAAMLAASGCAGLQINGTPPGTYSFKVSATGAQTGASVAQTMTLTVTP